MCCRDEQVAAWRRVEAAEVTLREHGLYRLIGEEESSAKWSEAKDRFDRAMADFERLCQTCCR